MGWVFGSPHAMRVVAQELRALSLRVRAVMWVPGPSRVIVATKLRSPAPRPLGRSLPAPGMFSPPPMTTGEPTSRPTPPPVYAIGVARLTAFEPAVMDTLALVEAWLTRPVERRRPVEERFCRSKRGWSQYPAMYCCTMFVAPRLTKEEWLQNQAKKPVACLLVLMGLLTP